MDAAPAPRGELSEPGSRWPTTVVAALAAALAGSYLGAPSGSWSRTVHLAASTGVAVAIVLVVALRWRTWTRPWVCAAAAVVCWTLGDWLWSRHDWSQPHVPPLTLADPLYLLSRVLLGAAMLLLIGRRRAQPDFDRRIDATAVALVAALAAWEFAINPTLAHPGLETPVRLLLSGYAVVDVALFVLLAWLVVIHRRLSPSAVALVVGVISWLAADLAYLVSLDQGGYAFGRSRMIDGLWLCGLVLVAIASVHPSRRELAVIPPRAAQPPSALIVVAVAALVVPSGTMTVSTVANGEPARVPALLATASLAVLVTVRLLRLDRARDQAEAQLRHNERHYRALAANSADAVLIVDANGRITNESAALAALVGLPGVPTAGSSVFARIDPADQPEVRATFARSLNEPGRVHSLEVRVHHVDGSTLWVSARFVNLLDDPAVGGVVVNVHDVTARKQAEAAIEHQAFHDALTGLANRVRFRQRVEEALRLAERDPGLVPAILFIDLDRFKWVNDTLGHEAGDELLRIAAARVRGAVRPVDTVARLGGDEFAVLIAGGGDIAQDASTIAGRVLASLSAPVAVSGRSVAVGASIGVAVADRGSSPSALLSDADIAMYAAKAAGRGHWVMFDPIMRTEALEQLRLEEDLAGAVDRGELQLTYQPIIELATGQVRGFEALVRWEHPTLGTLHPDRFIPLAEDTGVIGAIGRWVLQTATRTAATWQREFPREPALSISVNLSPRQLLDEALEAEVTAALAVSGLEPSALVLEVPETALVELGGESLQALGRLRQLGVRLAVEGFGTRYSSLGHLRQLPVDILKLAPAVVDADLGDRDVPNLLGGLLDLGRGLGFELVAAGIERASQLDSLRAQGGVAGQGYFFAHPLSELDAEALLIEPRGAWRQEPSERG